MASEPRCAGGRATGDPLEDPVEFSDEVLDTADWIIDRRHDATWDGTSDDVRRSAREPVHTVAPVMGDPEEMRRRIAAWAQKWSYT